MKNTTTKFIYIYVNLLYYKHRSLQHVSATNCVNHQCMIMNRLKYFILSFSSVKAFTLECEQYQRALRGNIVKEEPWLKI